MLFFRSQCPRCGASTGINLETSIVGEYRSLFYPPPRCAELVKDLQSIIGRQNLTHFVCGPNRDVCHYAWSMLN